EASGKREIEAEPPEELRDVSPDLGIRGELEPAGLQDVPLELALEGELDPLGRDAEAFELHAQGVKERLRLQRVEPGRHVPVRRPGPLDVPQVELDAVSQPAAPHGLADPEALDVQADADLRSDDLHEH